MKVEIDQPSCIGCGICVDDCVMRCIALKDKKAQVDLKNCIDCGHCFANCPTAAISMYDIKAEKAKEKFDLSNINDAVKMRRSIRHFTGPIPQEELINLIQQARFCPSAHNCREVKFAVLQRETVLVELGKAVAEMMQGVIPNAVQVQEKVDLVFRGAPHVIVAYVDEKVRHYPMAEDGVIAMTSIELLAQQHSFGTFWVGFLSNCAKKSPEIRKLMGLEGKEIICSLGIGKANLRQIRPVERKDVEISFI